MLLAIEYALPGGSQPCKEAFTALQALLGGSGNEILLSPSGNAKPDTLFRLYPTLQKAGVNTGLSCSAFEFPASFFPRQTPDSIGLPFVEAAKRLTGCIARVDHTGLVVPSGIPSRDWKKAVNFLARNAAVYDYPVDADGYDPQTMRWLCVVPVSEKERTSGMEGEQLRQPKFEMVWNAAISRACMQIAVETRLSREQIKEKFPGDESFDLPGLGPYSRSVMTQSPWPGIPYIRFDLRYRTSTPDQVDPWNSARILISEGIRVTGGRRCAAARLPDCKAG